MASVDKADCTQFALNLAELAARQDLPSEQRWSQIADTSRTLADRLRIKSEADEHSALGRTPLARTLNSLLSEALGGRGIPPTPGLNAIYEILRVAANFCSDHDGNRGALLKAHFPNNVLNLLDRYVSLPPPSNPTQPLQVSLADLKVLKVSAGLLLNASLNFDPVRDYLVNAGAPKALVALRTRIYPPTSWSGVQTASTEVKEEWEWRRGFADWSTLALSELLSTDSKKSQPLPHESLEPLIKSLVPFIPPYSQIFGPFMEQLTSRHSFIAMDVEFLSDTCSTLESLTLDSRIAQTFLASTVDADEPNGKVPLLKLLVDFIELGDYPPYWASGPESEVDKWKKSFDLCKGAAVKSLVEVAGEISNLDVLWDFEKPHGWFVSRLVKWVKDYTGGERDDVLYGGCLCLANLARKETHCAALVQPPLSLISELGAMLDSTDIKVKHGALSLLKHLSQTNSSRPALNEANFVEKLVKSQLWSDKFDMAEPAQLLGIGTTKHLCTNNALNAIRLALTRAPDSDGSPSGVEQLLALVKRSDTESVKGEGTRVIFQVIRSICKQNQNGSVDEEQRRQAIKILTMSTAATALAEMAHWGRSKPYIILISEGIHGLALLGMQPSGGAKVAETLLSQAPPRRVPSSSRSTSQSSQASPVSSPATLLELLHELTSQESLSSGQEIAPEVRVNALTLLGAAGRKDIDTTEAQQVREESKELIEKIATDTSVDVRLNAAAKQALELWK